MTEWLLFLILGLLALCLVGAVCGLIELVLGWLDRRDADRLSEEWRRREVENHRNGPRAN